MSPEKPTKTGAEQRELADAVHEIRSPLAGARAALDVALEGDDDTMREIVRAVAARLAEIDARLDRVSGSDTPADDVD